MKTLLILLLAGTVLVFRSGAQTNAVPAANDSAVETIVLIRHAEKPHGGLGQLTCRGLNRALALPKVLLAKFGKPDFMFAPNPTQKVDLGQYYYVRPLATIEPTAIRCELPVNTEFGYLEIKQLEDELAKPKYRTATVLIAWEHVLEDQFAKKLVKDNGGDAHQVPDWPGNDYDTIFVFKMTHAGGGSKITFSIDHEGLNNLSDECP